MCSNRFTKALNHGSVRDRCSGTSLWNCRNFWFVNTRWAKQIASTSHRNPSSPRHFQNPKGTQDFKQTVNLIYSAGNFEDKGFWSNVHDPGSEHFDQFHKMG